jgi:hypothetical protein
MTKAEIAAFCARNKEKLSQSFPPRPVTEARMKRIMDLKAFHEETKRRYPVVLDAIGDD